MIKPGGTIGILGGGQLGAMLAVAAADLGFECISYSPEAENVASPYCAETIRAGWDDGDAMAAFAAKCGVITWEFENVPVPPLQPITEHLLPHPRALETAQDRLSEKVFVEDLGGQPAQYAKIDTHEELLAAVDRMGAPGILKTRRDGYDGKGQWRIMTARDADGIRMPDTPAIYEGFVDFEAEFSVILVRGQDGEIRFWDSAQNDHVGGILATSTLPAAPAVTAQVPAARKLAGDIADRLSYVGVMTCEFFAARDGSGPIFNEMAPRVHNSGHWTIEGAATSQFENHIRAITGMDLGDTATTAPHLTMHNLIGDAVEGAHDRFTGDGVYLHLYGKADARPGRKMGHVTTIGQG